MKSLEDIMTNWLMSLIPVSRQSHIRDSGAFRSICDFVTTIYGVILGICQPSALVDFFRIRKQLIFEQIEKDTYIEHFQTLDCNDNDEIRRLLVFVHGGAWGSGHPWMYRLSANGLAHALAAQHVVMVGYPVYPVADISKQVGSVISTMDYIKSCSGPWNSSCRPEIVLAGHSSGANICALAMLDCIECEKSLADVFVGLSGVYDLEKHHYWEADRGVHVVSPMTAASGGFEMLSLHSPSTRVLDLNKSLHQSWSLPQCLLLHGLQDTTVPHTSSAEFESAMRLQGFSIFSEYYESSHVDPVLHLIARPSAATSSTHQALFRLWSQYVTSNS